MKNFPKILKSKLNIIFPHAGLSDETTESEIIDFLESRQGVKTKAATLPKSRGTIDQRLRRLSTKRTASDQDQVTVSGIADRVLRKLNVSEIK